MISYDMGEHDKRPNIIASHNVNCTVDLSRRPLGTVFSAVIDVYDTGIHFVSCPNVQDTIIDATCSVTGRRCVYKLAA